VLRCWQNKRLSLCCFLCIVSRGIRADILCTGSACQTFHSFISRASSRWENSQRATEEGDALRLLQTPTFNFISAQTIWRFFCFALRTIKWSINQSKTGCCTEALDISERINKAGEQLKSDNNRRLRFVWRHCVCLAPKTNPLSEWERRGCIIHEVSLKKGDDSFCCFHISPIPLRCCHRSRAASTPWSTTTAINIRSLVDNDARSVAHPPPPGLCLPTLGSAEVCHPRATPVERVAYPHVQVAVLPCQQPREAFFQMCWLNDLQLELKKSIKINIRISLTASYKHNIWKTQEDFKQICLISLKLNTNIFSVMQSMSAVNKMEKYSIEL